MIAQRRLQGFASTLKILYNYIIYKLWKSKRIGNSMKIKT